MVPICFNVSVYLMDATRQRMEKSIISKEDKCGVQDEAVRTSDTSLIDELVVVNPISALATLADKEDIKASEIYDASQNIAKSTDVISPVPGSFLLYSLTISQAKKTSQKSPLLIYLKMLIRIFQVLGCFPAYRLIVGQTRKILQLKLLLLKCISIPKLLLTISQI